MRFEPPLGIAFSTRFDTDQETQVHCECRDCGKNLPSESTGCPRCGGEVAVYEW